MSADLLKAFRKERLFTVEVGKFTFIVRRPNAVEAGLLYKDQASFHDIASKFVSGWKNVTERDVVPSTKSDAEVEFDETLWREWCSDNPEFWMPIANEVLAQFQRHTKQKEDAVKN